MKLFTKNKKDTEVSSTPVMINTYDKTTYRK